MVSYTSLDRATCEVVRMVKEAPSKGALPSVLKGLPPSISFTRMNANVSASTGIVMTPANHQRITPGKTEWSVLIQ